MIESASSDQLLIVIGPLAVAAVALYIWTALALAAVFAKSGESAWKAWVPIANLVAFLQLGGVSGWFALFLLIPGLGPLVVWVAMIMAAHRVNLSFGLSGSMTVLAAVLFPVWATVVGFGSARWVGRERRRGRDDEFADTRDLTGTLGEWLGLDTPPAAPVSHASPYAPQPPQPAAPESPVTLPQPPVTQPAPPVAQPSQVIQPPVLPVADVEAGYDPAPFAPPAPAARPLQTGATGLRFLDEDSDEVTGAASDAPAPVSAAGRAPDAVAALIPSGAQDHAWGSVDESDAFPEESGAVSAIAGAPAAGAPRTARAAIGSDDDDFDATMIAHRNRPRWSLVTPEGEQIELRSPVVLLGRRPSPEPGGVAAQLVALDDGTVSKTHARLELRGDTWFVTDLGSTNGVVVVSPTGDELELDRDGQAPATERIILGDLELRLVRASR